MTKTDPTPMIELTLRVANSIGDVAAAAWDACANPAGPVAGNGSDAADRGCLGKQGSISTTYYNPFISHDFLSALELSQSVRARVGWQPMHSGVARSYKPFGPEDETRLSDGLSRKTESTSEANQIRRR